MNIPVSPTLTNPTSTAGLTVSRGKGMTVTWNGNGSTGYVELVLQSAADAGASASVTCMATATGGTFTIPTYMLFTLPNGTGTMFHFQVGGPTTSGSFTAQRLDFGFAQVFVDGASLSGFPITN